MRSWLALGWRYVSASHGFYVFVFFILNAMQSVEMTSLQAPNHNFEDAHNMEMAIETMAKTSHRPTSPRTATTSKMNAKA